MWAHRNSATEKTEHNKAEAHLGNRASAEAGTVVTAGSAVFGGGGGSN